jgi:hypothetical protein
VAKQIVTAIVWDETEPTAPGGGRIRYRVEVEAPNAGRGESCYHIAVSEEAVTLQGAVYEADRLLLDEADLSRMISALEAARQAIRVAKTTVPPLSPA